MGSACCCFNVQAPGETVNSHENAGCIWPICFIHNLFNKYPAFFGRQQIQALPSADQSPHPLTTNVAPNNALRPLLDTVTSPSRSLSFDTKPNLQQNQTITRHDNVAAQLQLHKRLDQLRISDHIVPENVSGKDKSVGSWGERVCILEPPLKFLSEKVKSGVGCVYGSSEDEDVCPTCLEEYTPENPRIVLQCTHQYHLGCIYEWMERSEACPICGKVMLFEETS